MRTPRILVVVLFLLVLSAAACSAPQSTASEAGGETSTPAALATDTQAPSPTATPEPSPTATLVPLHSNPTTLPHSDARHPSAGNRGMGRISLCQPG